MKHDCGNCRFYKGKGPAHIGDGHGVYLSDRHGTCRRFPEHVPTHDGKWCGEHQPADETT